MESGEWREREWRAVGVGVVRIASSCELSSLAPWDGTRGPKLLIDKLWDDHARSYSSMFCPISLEPQRT